MSNSHVGLWALAVGVLLIGGLWAGLPAATLLILLVCPLMMFFMMRGMHGGEGHQHTEQHTGPRQDDHDQHPTSR